MLASDSRPTASRLARLVRRGVLAAVLPAALAGTVAVAPAAHADVNTDTAPYAWLNVGDCHIMVGGYLNPDRYGYGDATVRCTDLHSVDVSVYLLMDGTVIREGYQSAGVPISDTGDVLTTPPVCGADSKATWQTMAVVTIDGAAYHVETNVGHGYDQGACP
jgi:hypothetical protein